MKTEMTAKEFGKKTKIHDKIGKMIDKKQYKRIS